MPIKPISYTRGHVIEGIDLIMTRLGHEDQSLKPSLQSHTLAENVGLIAKCAKVKCLALNHLFPMDLQSLMTKIGCRLLEGIGLERLSLAEMELEFLYKTSRYVTRLIGLVRPNFLDISNIKSRHVSKLSSCY